MKNLKIQFFLGNDYCVDEIEIEYVLLRFSLLFLSICDNNIKNIFIMVISDGLVFVFIYLLV